LPVLGILRCLLEGQMLMLEGLFVGCQRLVPATELCECPCQASQNSAQLASLIQVVGVLIDQLLPEDAGLFVDGQRLLVATQVCEGPSKRLQNVAQISLIAEVVRMLIDVLLPQRARLPKSWERLSVAIQAV